MSTIIDIFDGHETLEPMIKDIVNCFAQYFCIIVIWNPV